jgi:thymidylate synthase
MMTTLNNAIDYCKTRRIPNVFICGGKQLYNETFKNMYFDEIYLSEIDHDYNCDNKLDKQLINIAITKFPHTHHTKLQMFDKSINQNVSIEFKKFYQKTLNQNNGEQQYLNLMEKILNTGEKRKTRNAITYSKFGETLDFDLSKGFPLLTTKKMFLRGIAEELFFFLNGDTNSNHLMEKGINIWKQNTTRSFLDNMKLHYDEGDMGPMYGYQWKHYGTQYKGTNYNYKNSGFDQIKYCLELLKKDQNSRRIVMTTYNPTQAFQGVLFPCHGLTTMFTIEGNNKLSCMMTQRSADYICGVPFNIASYALLVNLMCHVINNDKTYNGNKLIPGRLIINLGDVHIYEQHIDIAKRQILREPYEFPKLHFNKKITSLENIKYDDIDISNYISYPKLNANMIA